MQLHRRFFHERIPFSAIGNMDETLRWLDMPGETTVEHVDARSVPLRTTGHEKSLFTVVLASVADRWKLKPFIVLRDDHVRPIRELTWISGVVVVYSQNGWMDEQLTKDWVIHVWGSLAFTSKFSCGMALPCYGQHHLSSSIAPTVSSASPLLASRSNFNQPTSRGILHSRSLNENCMMSEWQQERSLSHRLGTCMHQASHLLSSG